MPSGATSRPRIDLRRAWPRRRSASTTGTGRTSWRWSRRPDTRPRPGAASRPRRRAADGSRPCARCAVTRPEDWRAIRAVDPATAPGYSDVVETAGPRGLRPAHRRRAGGRDTPGALDPRRPPGRRPARRPPARVAGPRRRRAPGPRRDPDPLCRALPRPRVWRACSTRCTPPPSAALGASGLRGSPRAARSGGPGRPRLAGDCCVWSTSRGQSPSARWQPGPPTSSAGRRAPICRRSPTATRACGPPRSAGSTPRALRDEPPATAVAAARAALAGVGERGLVVGPGGPVWPDTPDEVLTAVIRALGGVDPPDSRPRPLTPSVRGADRARRRAPSAGGSRATWAW